MQGKAHAIASAEGPSRAGPISERVVKPEALCGERQYVIGGRNEHNPPSTKTSNIRGWRWHRQECQLVWFVGRHRCGRGDGERALVKKWK